MNYFEWLGDLEAIDIRFPEMHFNGWWMVECLPVIGWRGDVLATYSPDDALAVSFGLSDNGWPVFSPRMRDFLDDAAPGLVQFLPFRLQRRDGSGEAFGYCVGQILRLVDCLDRKRTRVRKNWQPINERGDFGAYRPFVLDRSLAENERLFRLKGNRRSIVVRDDLKTAIEQAGFDGQRFDLLETS